MAVDTSIVWLRSDLRLEDNPALRAAADRGGPVVPVYVWAPRDEEPWAPGAASRWWLHRSLTRLDEELRKVGSRLVLRHGDVLENLRQLIRSTGAGAVFWNRRYEPRVIERDKTVKESLRGDGVEVKSFNASLLFEPWAVATKQGGPYKVFTPFYKACLRESEPATPMKRVRKLISPKQWPKGVELSELELEPKIDWAKGIRAAWTPGERGAARLLKRYLSDAAGGYPDDRDRPDLDGTSRLSPHLHFGEIGPRTIWHAVTAHADVAAGGGRTRAAESYLRQLAWRDFAHHLLFHFPHTTDRPLREQFSRFPWRRDAKGLRAWQQGRTGFPIIDAGMRQLWRTGWMHNRVRMLVGSFLVKDLLIPWQEGAKWFWDTLVDANLANNTLGWQWVAGCGADAAPYFRVFNPTTQGLRFDAAGEYVRRYVPELQGASGSAAHEPWKTPDGLDAGYPPRIVDHGEAREAALAAYALTRNA